VVLGMSFTTSVAGQVNAIRFYKATGNTGTHLGWLWGSDATTPLASVTFANETASGWQSATLSTPVQLAVGQTYTVSYLAPNGNYSYQPGVFTSPVTSGPLTAGSPNNGLYTYGTSGKPTSTYGSTNYFVDVEFVANPSPTVIATTPAASATNVDPATAKITATLANASSATLAVTKGGSAVAGTSAFNATTGVVTFTPGAALAYGTTYSVTATANGAAVTGGTWTFTTRPAATLTATTPAASAKAVDPATVKVTATLANATSGTLTLTAGGTAVAGTSSFNATTGVVTFTPTATLGWSTTYTATVTANSGAVANGTWSFSTSGKPVSLFPTGTPATPNAKASQSVQVGTRFTSNAAGVVTAIRFYKGSSNTGTHTGYLWNAKGTRVASVTFSNETASGWQTATLSAPVRLTVGAEYRVSVYAPSGYYAVTTAGLLLSVSNGPLSTPAVGGAYGTNASYPSTTSTNNYWVDIVFHPDS
jgi:hypothetical protein